jgi:hypothetical protein
MLMAIPIICPKNPAATAPPSSVIDAVIIEIGIPEIIWTAMLYIVSTIVIFHVHVLPFNRPYDTTK